jgi:hypothetical protein
MPSQLLSGIAFLVAIIQAVNAGICPGDPQDPGCCLQAAVWEENGQTFSFPLIYDRSSQTVRQILFACTFTYYNLAITTNSANGHQSTSCV